MTSLSRLKPGQSFSELPVRVVKRAAIDASGSRSCELADGLYRISGNVTDRGLDVVRSTALELTTELLFELFPSSAESPESMAAELKQLIQCGPNASAFFDVLSADPLFTKFKVWPAAMINHHATVGGLLEHTLSMLKIAAFLVDHYNAQNSFDVSREIVMCGVLMHDFCKTEELVFRHRIDYSTHGRLLGHVALGFAKVRSVCERAGLPASFEDALSHAVLSHHGKKEYGAPVEPHTPEAVLLHQVDMLDSRMKIVSQLVESGTDSHGWTEYSRALGARMFLGEPDEHS